MFGLIERPERSHPCARAAACSVRPREQSARERNGTADRARAGRHNSVGFENGYADGYEKGLDDGAERREVNPTRHKWYRSADRHYDPSYGSRAAYANVYRDGFRSGYESGYADGERYQDRSGTSRVPWPF